MCNKREVRHSPVAPRTGNEVNLCILGNMEQMPFRFTSQFSLGMGTGDGVQIIQTTPITVYIVPECNRSLRSSRSVTSQSKQTMGPCTPRDISFGLVSTRVYGQAVHHSSHSTWQQTTAHCRASRTLNHGYCVHVFGGFRAAHTNAMPKPAAWHAE